MAERTASRQRAIVTIVGGVLSVAGALVAFLISSQIGLPRTPPAVSVESVRLAVAPENVPFFEDPEVRKVFLDNGFNVQLTLFGSHQLATIDLSKYDAIVPSNQITASHLVTNAGELKDQPEIPLFQSPLAIATYQPIAACLKKLGIASQDAQGVWRFNIAAYLVAVKHGLRWSVCGASLSPLAGKILLTTTNPQCSNSGGLFLAVAGFVANGNSVVTNMVTARKVGRELAPSITEQGLMDSTTDLVFRDYLANGMNTTPMALIYESQFISQEITNPGDISPDMVLMYAAPNAFAQRVLIPLPGDSRGTAIGQLIVSNPELRRLAQEHYGLRTANIPEFQKVIGSHRIFGKEITVPAQIAQAPIPAINILDDLINAASSTPVNSAPAC